MKKLFFTVIFFVLQFAFAQKPALHFSSLVVDMHSDVLNSHLDTGRNIEHFSRQGMVDLDRLKMGGVDAQFFVLWPDPDQKKQMGMYAQAVRVLDTLDALIDRNPQRIALCRTPDDIEKTVAQNKIAALIGLEGGSAIEDDLGKIDYFYKRGMRYLGLTWNDSPSWASSALDETTPDWQGHKGLNDFGRRVIRQLNDLGVLVDVSHSGEQTFYDVLHTSTKPVIASHSSVYAICPHFRNLKDDQIRALAKKGGVMFINFYPSYLVKGFDDIYQRARKRATEIQDSLKKSGSTKKFDRSAYIMSKISGIYPDVKTVVDHIDYVVKLVGDDYVGLGSDFDGIPIAPHGLRDVSKMPAITTELLRRGYSETSIKKILGGNFMRVFKAVAR